MPKRRKKSERYQLAIRSTLQLSLRHSVVGHGFESLSPALLPRRRYAAVMSGCLSALYLPGGMLLRASGLVHVPRTNYGARDDEHFDVGKVRYREVAGFAMIADSGCNFLRCDEKYAGYKLFTIIGILRVFINNFNLIKNNIVKYHNALSYCIVN